MRNAPTKWLAGAFAVLAALPSCSSDDRASSRRANSTPDAAAPAEDGGKGGAAGSEEGHGGSTGGSAGAADASNPGDGRATDSGSAGAPVPGGETGTDAALPHHHASNCDHLASAGTWENVTPPVTELPGNAPCPYGGAFVVNPLDPATIYLGSCNEGIWKSTDCGATWVHVDTGTNGDVLDGGRQWTFVIDPVDPLVLYTNSGYGSKSNGAFKSTNGGVDWEPLWPPADPAQASIVEYNFVGGIAMDPKDRLHLLVTFHAKCAAPHPEACFAESTDGGATFRIVDGQSDWAGGEGQAAYFLENGKTWLWGSQSNGLWRTADSGMTWKPVTDKQTQGHGAGQMYRSKSGVFYLPVLNGILRSPDGVTWDIVPNSGSIMMGMTGNGATMWASRGFPWDPSTNLYEPFWSSPESDGLTWKQMASPMLSNGGELQYDPDHHLLYASNLGAGFWRVVTE